MDAIPNDTNHPAMAAAVSVHSPRPQHGAVALRWRRRAGFHPSPLPGAGGYCRDSSARVRQPRIWDKANRWPARRASRARRRSAVHRRIASPRAISARLARKRGSGRGVLDARRRGVFRAWRQPRPQRGQQTIRPCSHLCDSRHRRNPALAYSQERRSGGPLVAVAPAVPTVSKRTGYPRNVYLWSRDILRLF